MSFRPLLKFGVNEQFLPDTQRFATMAEAEECAKVMLARDWHVLDWAVEESTDPVNRKWNFFKSIPEPFELLNGGTK